MQNYPTSENECVTKNFVIQEKMEMILILRIQNNFRELLTEK